MMQTFIWPSFRPACRWHLGICRPVVFLYSAFFTLLSIALFAVFALAFVFRGCCLAFWCFPCLSLPIHVVISSLLSYIKKSSVFTFSPHTLYSAERNRSNHSHVMGLFHRLFASLHVIVTHKLFCGLDWCHSHHLLPINNISYEDTVHLTHCER